MRINSPNFDAANNAASKEIRLVIEILFDTPVYITSHTGIDVIGDVLDGMLKKTSASSQKLNPLEARSEIGSISFEAVDIGGAVTDKLREKDVAGEGLRGTFVRLWLGYPELPFVQYRLEQTQVIDKPVEFDGGTYKFKCRDILREARKDIFDLASTRVSQDFLIGETATLNVLTTDRFEAATHGPEWGLDPSSTVYYLQIIKDKQFEIISATGKTSNTFTSLTRALFGTTEIDHTVPAGGSTPTTGPEVRELVYLEGTGPHVAYQLLTGKNFSDVDVLPSSWHLGIDPAYVDKTSFENIGEDLHDTADANKGFFLRAEGIKKTDGKRFIETEICRLMSCYPLVGPDGKIYLRKMQSALSTATYVDTLDNTNITKASGYSHNLDDVKNVIVVDWAYLATVNDQDPGFYRTSYLIDADSVTKNKGESKHYSMKFKMLHSARHTQSTLNTALNGIRDRHAGPPERIKLDLLPSKNNIEVGDVARVNLTHLRDYQGPANLDRPMEVQQRTIDQVNQRVTVAMFGSSAEASPLGLSDGGGGPGGFELPDDWYTANVVELGTELSTVLTIDGSGFVTADGTLNGSLASRTVFYYDGDLTIQSGVTITVNDNVEIRVKGHLQIDGVFDVNSSAIGSYIGSGRGGDSVREGGGPSDGIINGDPTNGSNDQLPNLIVTNSDGAISGVPFNMCGSQGGNGADNEFWIVGDQVYEETQIGGVGGKGGGSIVFVSRGAGFGAAGEIILSGASGAGPTDAPGWPGGGPGSGAGSGMGGAPGCCVFLIDGTSGTNFPILAGNIEALYGTSPGPASGQNNGTDLGTNTSVVMYVPNSPGGYPSYP